MKKHESDEGFYDLGDGERDDATFHGEILSTPGADRKLARIAIARAVADGLSLEEAERLYRVVQHPSSRSAS